MSIWNKVLVGLIAFASLIFFYMAARTLKTHQYWHSLALKHQQRIGELEQQNHLLAEGSGAQQDGIRQRRIALNQLLLDRGRVWSRCDPNVRIGDDGSATVTAAIESPNPHGIAKNTILYGFEEINAREQGRYLGEFKVTESDPAQKTVVLAPTLPLSPRQIERLSTAQRPWVLYEVLPHDDHEVFNSLAEVEKEDLLPPQTRKEYLDDGRDGFVRPLRDYQVLFSLKNLQRTLLADKVDATTRDLALVKDALDQALRQEEAVKRDVAEASQRREDFSRQRDAVAEFLKALEREYETVRTAVARLIEENRAKAGRIAQQQLEAARRIDERTRAMVQPRTGG